MMEIMILCVRWFDGVLTEIFWNATFKHSNKNYTKEQKNSLQSVNQSNAIRISLADLNI